MPNAQNDAEPTGTPFDDVFKTEIEKNEGYKKKIEER